MNDEEFDAYVEKKLAIKQRANERIQETGAIKQEWKCECGSVLSWDSTEHRQRHYKSRKHTQKVLPK